jgi:hypothetical protein
MSLRPGTMPRIQLVPNKYVLNEGKGYKELGSLNLSGSLYLREK